MKKTRKKIILSCMGGLFLILACGLALYSLTAAYERKAASKEFVDYLLQHADEAAADFEAYGLTFEKAEEEMETSLYEIVPWGAGGIGDVLIVTDADGRRFYYQNSEKYGNLLLKIEDSVERINMLAGKSELVTGSLRITRDRWGRNYACVTIRARFEVSGLSYRIPEFDDYLKEYRDEEAARTISQWISTEELSALYKKGKDLEDILSAYCELKRHNVDISIHSYEPE